MSYLLRRTRKAAWVGATRDRDDAVREFARSEADTDGLSVFEVESDEQREAVVAAIACERQNTGRIDIIEVAREEVERFGRVDRTPDKGTTSVPAANRLHCSLDWDAATLRRFAGQLFDENLSVREYAPPAVRTILRGIDLDAVVGDDALAFVEQEKARAKLKS